MNCAECDAQITEFPAEYVDRLGSKVGPKYYRTDGEQPFIFCSPHCGLKWTDKEKEQNG